jgi:hypothetical protein
MLLILLFGVLAVVTISIIEINNKIATAKYWNDSAWVGCFILEEFTELEPLR